MNSSKMVGNSHAVLKFNRLFLKLSRFSLIIVLEQVLIGALG